MTLIVNNQDHKDLIDDGWERHDIKTACYAAAKRKGTGILEKGSALEKQPRVETILIKPYDIKLCHELQFKKLF